MSNCYVVALQCQCIVCLTEATSIPISEGVTQVLLARAARAKETCRLRHDEFVVKLKNDINILVRKKLSQATMEGRFQSGEVGNSSFTFEDYGDEHSSSDDSDPLGKSHRFVQ